MVERERERGEKKQWMRGRECALCPSSHVLGCMRCEVTGEEKAEKELTQTQAKANEGEATRG